jgi:alpha-1,3-glucan synthase
MEHFDELVTRALYIPGDVQLLTGHAVTNDLVNANSGSFDPRHMYGTTNQDVFRWPAIERGVERQLLSHFITTLLMPGIPLMLWGEEQTFYVLDSTVS